MKYRIEVRSMGETVRVRETDDPGEAKRLYWQTGDNIGLFTRVYVDGKPLSIVAAEELFTCSSRENLARGQELYAHFQEERRKKGKRPLK